MTTTSTFGGGGGGGGGTSVDVRWRNLDMAAALSAAVAVDDDAEEANAYEDDVSFTTETKPSTSSTPHILASIPARLIPHAR